MKKNTVILDLDEYNKLRDYYDSDMASKMYILREKFNELQIENENLKKTT